jgi:hypothetical protein
VTDRAEELIYSGRIDDWAWDIGQKKLQAEHHDLEEALEAISKNDFRKRKSKLAIGCVIEK